MTSTTEWVRLAAAGVTVITLLPVTSGELTIGDGALMVIDCSPAVRSSMERVVTPLSAGWKV